MAQQYGQPREGNWETKLNFPLVAHTHAHSTLTMTVNPSNQTARWKYLFQRNCSRVKNQKCNILLSLLFLGIPLSIVRFPLKHGHHCRVYMWKLPQCDRSPWDRGELSQNAVAVLFVDIMLKFTWGNVRENHNIILLLRRGGQGPETGSDLIWGFYKPYCGKKKKKKETPQQNSTVQFSLILRNTTVMMCSWEKI